jgi:hypothetical protein
MLHVEHRFTFAGNLDTAVSTRNNYEVLKCGSAEGLGRSFGPIVSKIKK